MKLAQNCTNWASWPIRKSHVSCEQYNIIFTSGETPGHNDPFDNGNKNTGQYYPKALLFIPLKMF